MGQLVSGLLHKPQYQQMEINRYFLTPFKDQANKSTQEDYILKQAYAHLHFRSFVYLFTVTIKILSL